MAGEFYLQKALFPSFLDRLRQDGYEVHGPQIKDNAIVYGPLRGIEDLPRGFRDHQGPGRYALGAAEVDEEALWFAWANGPQALKPYVFAPREPLWQAARPDGHRLQFTPYLPPPRPLAIIGARACDLAALAIFDRHFLQNGEPDPQYHRRRENLLLVAVNCSHPAATCFCAATGDGPQVQAFHDLVLSELAQGFVVGIGSERGEMLVSALQLPPADAGQLAQVQHSLARAAAAQQRTLPGEVQAKLLTALDHERWQQVAERCLSCANCTAVCPTCFCFRAGVDGDISLRVSDHYREWDSCFNQGHSYMHGLTIRGDTALRYRQWLTHKFSFWHEQFGRSGCVGCGRCISWCPAGIDVTVELSAICG